MAVDLKRTKKDAAVFVGQTLKTEPFPVAARSKARVCGRSPAEIVGSNPAGEH